MRKPKNLVVAIFFASLILIFNMRFALAESDKMYFEFGASIGSGGEADAKFTDDNTTASWDIGDLVGAKLQVGWDLGKVRADVKARLMQGDVDAISGGVTSVNNIGSRSGPDVILGLATVNAYLDIADMKISEETSVTPYVGAGFGYARGFMQADGILAGVNRKDHRGETGTAISGVIGTSASLSSSVALTAEYEYIHTDLGDFDAHLLNLGLRFSY